MESSRIEVATLGGGCFWCTEAVFKRLAGVEKVEPGYSGGSVPNPTYEEVSTGKTGHAEVAQITFNLDIISFREILDVFFATFDPTTMNRQGPDTGPQYRSVIFYHTDEQKEVAEKVIEELKKSKAFKAPIVTQIEPFRAFYAAEDYHKDYFERHPEQQYCKVVIAPKIDKLLKLFGAQLNEDSSSKGR